MRPMVRAALCIVLLAAFSCFTVRSPELHVHFEAHADHHHGVAAHQHDGDFPIALNDLRLAALDADDTALSVRLSVTAGAFAKPAFAALTSMPMPPAPLPALVTANRVSQRAHSPPAARPPSLRAPPVLQPL